MVFDPSAMQLQAAACLRHGMCNGLYNLERVNDKLSAVKRVMPCNLVGHLGAGIPGACGWVTFLPTA